MTGGVSFSYFSYVMYYNNKNVEFSRTLRKNMTPWERKLWYCFLNTYPLRFYRQKPIGQYIADFYCPKANLVIELDGGGHYDTSAEEKDSIRSAQIEKLRIRVISFCNLDVDKNFRGLCEEIDRQVKERRTLP